MNSLWKPAPITPILQPREIHLWLCFLPESYCHFEYYKSLLQKDEQARAERFMFDKHRIPFVISQAYLRLILKRYLQRNPEEFIFARGPYGKPYLSQENLKFNMSHSHEHALYGICLNAEIGVDIEFHRQRSHLEGIIRTQFSTLEYEQYKRLNAALRNLSFYKGWVSKEAFIKATGMGLSFPLKSFSVDMNPTKPAKLLEIDHDKSKAAAWTLQTIESPKEYSAAFAVNDTVGQINYFSANKLFTTL